MNILITGGTSGIGLAMAKRFASLGHNVHVTSRNPVTISGLTVHKLELSNHDSLETFVQDLPLKNIDMLINNAGHGVLGPLTELTREQTRNQFETNVFGPMELVARLLPRLTGAHLVNVSSISPEVGLPFGGIYTASKAAMNCISDIWRLELAHLGIRVTTLRPGLLNTNFARNADQRLIMAPDSSFHKFRSSILARAGLTTKGTDPKVFADYVCTRLLSKRCPSIIYHGKGSFIFPLLNKLIPQKLHHKLLLNKFKLA
ncbi:MAG TPA: SDR family NAD(P)-dependent oxidoreductase [Bacteriovoracaceae bacterium]|nr:SDR family NAD(P)-dependent oxidoreductase [Bacteriovoracaceae bacterium]